MNKDTFLRYIENDRDCEHGRLDIAINRGIYKIKNDRFDPKKLFMLAAASVFSFVICLTVHSLPFSTAVEKYYQSRQKIMPGSSEVLDGYFKDIVNNLEKHLGGK
jgi:hypothetical protein